MSDYLERVEAFLDLHAQRRGHDVITSLAVGDGSTVELTQVLLRKLLADAKRLRAQGTEYGIDALRLAQIRDRSQRLAEIPFDHHDDANHIVTDLIDSAADVKWLIKQLDQTRTDTAPQQPEDGGDPR